ncbi:glycosyltransferase family 4 protein [Flavobacteriaceae bacterium S356]|uniref:Glycosyltransferase family 4 protein n=1 Tax=Asprobacillus argus TaxID=3076534 RepID=A0ABU3LDZ4_9FLAO|nr:glycosyltransferase family 4 protein [Flavobacteriaceae bacterium S356]
MSTIKTVLMSTAWLPFNAVGSWTTEMDYLLKRENQLDYVIGPRSAEHMEKPKQIFIDEVSFFDKIRSKKEPLNRFNPYIRALRRVVSKEDRILLQVKDNFGMLKAVLAYIQKNDLRKKIYVQYHFHSFYPFTSDEHILSQIDELVLLTKSSYQSFQRVLNTFPMKVTICPDGVDSDTFKPVIPKEKEALRIKHGIDKEALVFVWCSQDRKKKGLDLTLELWSKLTKVHSNIHLCVIGLTRDVQLKNVTFFGELLNNELIEYYQLSDFYLFPTLCQEGFGLSLLEALKSGAYCIAANNGSVSELLNEGEYGKLIENPNMIDDWIEGVNDAISIYEENDRINPHIEKIPKNLYDIHDWYVAYNDLIQRAKESFNFRFYI